MNAHEELINLVNSLTEEEIEEALTYAKWFLSQAKVPAPAPPEETE